MTRQTLYRHWPRRAALLVNLILTGPEADYPQPGSDPRQVLTAWLTSLRQGMDDLASRTAVLAVTAQADYDPDCAEALVRLRDDRLAALNGLLAPSGCQVSAGEYTLLYGPVLSRLLFDRGEASDEFIEIVVTRWLDAVAAPAPAGRGTLRA